MGRSVIELGLPRRIAEKIDTDSSGCWIWTAARSTGYGRVSYNGRTVVAHRVVYEILVGPIPDGLQLDHLCRNRACVRPDHLEPVTQRENLLRGQTIPARHAARTHCNWGHRFDSTNTGRTVDGYRRCRRCHAEREAQARKEGRR